ncbi:MAG: hypothetical protein QOJ63_1821 [Solirubrobacteraceae bacterium]|jgi:pimeloyl-ACP methyl ester carboxylesterase|nr:hypothetical protein [Solirubrobacteraceae bacterium]
MSVTPRSAGLSIANRVGFSFAPRGGHAAWLNAGVPGESVTLELLAGAGAVRRVRVPRLDLATQPVALDDGRALLCQHDRGTHQLRLIATDSQTTLGELPAQGFRVLPGPAVATIAYAISVTAAGASTVWRVDERAPALTPLLEVPAILSGGVWLDTAGTVLAANRIADGRPSDVVAIDLRRGTCTSLFSVSPRSNERVLACGAATGLLAVSTDAPGREWVGCGFLGGAPVRFSEHLRRPGHDTRVLGVDPAGRRLLVHERRGAVSEVSLYEPEGDRVTALPGTPGTVVGPASWSGQTLRIAWSAPTVPSTIAEVALGPRSTWSLGSDEPGRWAPARLERLQGAAGPIEAVVYGGADWRRSRQLVVALHGGPLAHWEFGFDGLFQSLAAAGVAVVAPNQRGSTGYGNRHMLAIRDAWGGPDLDDVRAIAHALADERRDVGGAELTVLGSSYGAFLALLAAQVDPQLWAGCIALSPFTSGPSLYAVASPTVRRLLERLGGLTVLHDDLGPRDVLARPGALTARLLVIHGTRDEQIPVDHARALRARLRDLDMSFSYHELCGEGHDLAGGKQRQLVHELVTDFCRHLPERSVAMR